MELGADLRDRPGMVEKGLSGAAHLPLVGSRRVQEGAREQLLVDSRVVRLDGADQLVDEVLMVLVDVDDSHTPSVLRGFTGESRAQERPLEERTTMPMLLFANRRERKALKLARLLVALDETAAHARKRPPRRRLGPSLGSSSS